MSKPILSSQWTGIQEGWEFGFRHEYKDGCGQLALFNIYQLYYDENGEVEYGTIVWSTRDISDRLRTFIDKVWRRWFFDNSKCCICKESNYIYPSNPFKAGYCPKHCPEHEFEYCRDMHEHCCVTCGDSAPFDYYGD